MGSETNHMLSRVRTVLPTAVSVQEHGQAKVLYTEMPRSCSMTLRELLRLSMEFNTLEIMVGCTPTAVMLSIRGLT